MLLVVCDGMGGHEHGDIASHTAVRVMAKLHQKASPKRPEEALLHYVGASHLQLHERMRAQGPVTMGTTLTACWFHHRKAYWTQVGDSHLYLFRDGHLKKLTRAQTRNEFGQRDGREATPDGQHLCQNFIYGSRGLGDDAALRLDPGLDSGTEVLQTGDRLLLASDGLWGALGESDIADVLDRVPYPQQAVEALVEKTMRAGSVDNITAILTVVGDLAPPEGWDQDDIETHEG